MKYSHIPFTLTHNGKTYYTNMKYAYKMGKLLNKSVVRNKIIVPYTNWDMRIDVYTGRKTIQKDLEGNPKKISSRPVEIYGYYLVEKTTNIKSSNLPFNEIHISLDNMLKVYYKHKKEKGFTYETCKRIMNKNFNGGACFGFIFDITGDIIINLKTISKYTFHKDYLHNVCSCLSHEVLHSVLLKTDSEESNLKWDNIAIDLELQGYLGGSASEELFEEVKRRLSRGE